MEETPKKRLAVTEESSIDRLSALPDELLMDIALRLPTKNAFATRVLSRKWERIWALCIPVLSDFHFDAYSILYPDKPSVEEHRDFSFIKFVNDVLLHPCIQQIRKFSLTADVLPEDKIIVNWIDLAVQKKVEELILDVVWEDPIMFPPSLFACDSLKVLKMNQFSVDCPVPSVIFSNLTILHVYERRFSANDPVALRFFKNCNRLEELSIDGNVLACKDAEKVVFQIGGTKLKRLKFRLIGEEYDSENYDGSCNVYIDAENLESLDVYDDFFASYKFNVNPVLKEAKIDIGYCLGYEDDESNTRIEDTFQFLTGLSNARSLSLSASTCVAFYFASKNKKKELPLFENLTHLEVGVADCCGWKFPQALKYNALELQQLILNKENHHHGFHDFRWKLPTNASFFSNLTRIKVGGVKCNSRDVALLKHFLACGRVLEQLVVGIVAGYPPATISAMRKNLSTATRASKACKIIFS